MKKEIKYQTFTPCYSFWDHLPGACKLSLNNKVSEGVSSLLLRLISTLFPPCFLLSTTLFLIPAISHTQPLPALLETAATNNPELKGIYQEYLAALEKGPQLSQLPEPELGVGVSILPVETRLGPQQVRIGITQMFPWRGTLNARKEVALTMAKARYERIEAARLALFYEVKKSYYQLYELHRSRRILERNIRVFEALERLALAKVESGKGKLADVLRIQLQRDKLQKELELIDNRRQNPLISLNRVLNRPLDTPVQVTDSLRAAVLPIVKDTLLAQINNLHPRFQMLTIEQQAARQTIELNRLEGKPSFGLGIDYILTGGRNDASPENNGRDALMPRVAIKIPLYRQKYTARKREQERQIAAIDYQKTDLKTRFEAIVEKAYAEHRDAILKIELYEQQIRTTNTIIALLQTSYSAEGEDFDELLRLKIQLTDYELMILRAIVQTHMTRIEIEKLLPEEG